MNPDSRKQQVVGEEGSPLRGYTYYIGLAIYAVAEYAPIRQMRNMRMMHIGRCIRMANLRLFFCFYYVIKLFSVYCVRCPEAI